MPLAFPKLADHWIVSGSGRPKHRSDWTGSSNRETAYLRTIGQLYRSCETDLQGRAVRRSHCCNMMGLTKYVVASSTAAGVVLWHAFATREQCVLLCVWNSRLPFLRASAGCCKVLPARPRPSSHWPLACENDNSVAIVVLYATAPLLPLDLVLHQLGKLSTGILVSRLIVNNWQAVSRHSAPPCLRL